MPRFDDADRERKGTQTSGQLFTTDPGQAFYSFVTNNKPNPWMKNSQGQTLDPQTGQPIVEPMTDPLPPGPWSVDALQQGDAQARQALSGNGMPAPWELPSTPRVPVTPAGAPPPPARSSGGGAAPAPKPPPGPSPALQAQDDKTKADLAAAKAQRDQDSLAAMDEISAIREGELKRQTAEAESGKVLSDYRQGVDDLAKMVPDRNRWWSSRNTGQRFAAVVSSALNTINQNMFGGGGEDPIQRFINQDLEHQKQEADAKRARLDAMPGLYKMLRDRGLSDAVASTGAKLEMIRAGKAMISDQLAGARDQQLIANGKQRLAALDAAEAEGRMKLQEHADKHGEAQAETALKWAQVKAAQAKPVTGGANDPLTRQVGNRLIRFKDEKEARNFDETLTAAAVHSDALDKLEELSKKPGILPALGRVFHVGSDFETANAARDDITGMSNAAKGISTQMPVPVTERLNHALTPGLFSSNAGPIGIEREGSIKGIAQTLISQGVSPQDAVEAARAAIAAQKLKFDKGH